MKERKSWDGSGGEIRTKLFGFFEIINSPVLEILSFSFKRRFQPGRKGVFSFLLQRRNEKKEEGKEREKPPNLALFCFAMWQRGSSHFFLSSPEIGVVFLPVGFLREESSDTAP